MRRQRSPARPSRGAFTLVELLVVIGIIAILIATLLPVLGRVREQSRRTKCLANLRSVGQSLFIYANQYRDRLPNGNPPQKWTDYNGSNRVMVEFADNIVKGAGIFHCPSDPAAPPARIVTADQTLPDSARGSYEFYSLFWAPEYGPLLTRFKGRAPLAWDKDGGPRDPAAPPDQKSDENHGPTGGNVLFADGHAAWQLAAHWHKESWPSPANEFFPAPP